MKKRAAFFSTPRELRLTVDASAFYPSIEEHYGTGDLPFYRVGDVDGMVDVNRALRIPSDLCQLHSTLKRVSQGDILFTKGGAIDRAGYVVTDGAVSRDLIFLKSSKLSKEKQLMLFTYFRTAFFRRLLSQSSSQTAQPHLTITLVRDLPVFLGSDKLAECVSKLTVDAYNASDKVEAFQRSAENCLFEALGLADWKPSEPLTYTARASAAFAAGRIDSQYFRPVFSEVEKRLRATGEAVELGSILTVNARGRQPQYTDDGLPVINSKHVRANRVILSGNRLAVEAGSPVVIEKNDVLGFRPIK